MSLAKRMFGRLLSRDEKPKVEDGLPPEEEDIGSSVPPPAVDTEDEDDAEDDGPVSPPSGSARGATDSAVPGDRDEPAASPRRPTIPLSPSIPLPPPDSPAPTPMLSKDDPLRRSQTIKLTAPTVKEEDSQALERPLREELRRSQTVRINPPPRPVLKAVDDGEPDEDLGTIIMALPGPGTLGGQSARAESARVTLPAMAVLSCLPAASRGPAWREETDPGGTFTVDQEALLTQLKSGAVQVTIDSIAAQLPAGWVRDGAAGKVPLDLPRVVEALPERLLQGAREEDLDVAAARAAGALFMPAADAGPA